VLQADLRVLKCDAKFVHNEYRENFGQFEGTDQGETENKMNNYGKAT